jgi:hypothetical protein
LLLDADLLSQEFLLHLALLPLRGQVIGLCFQPSLPRLSCLLQSHELLVVFLEQHHLLLFHLLIQHDVELHLLLICQSVQVVRLLFVFLTQLIRTSMCQAYVPLGTILHIAQI